MFFYKFNVGDYVSNTAHLSLTEDLAYRRLIDLYATKEKPIQLDIETVSKLIRMRTHSECIASVLNEFFVKTEDGYLHEELEEQIFNFSQKIKGAKKAAKARWSKKIIKNKDIQPMRTHSECIANELQTDSERNAIQYPLSSIQDTVSKTHEKQLCHPGDISEIFDFWCGAMSKSKAKTKLTEKRKSCVIKIIKQGYSIDDIKRAITGCTKSKFHMGENEEGGVHNDLTLICRSGDKLEGFIEMNNRQPRDKAQQPKQDYYERPRNQQEAGREINITNECM